MVSRIPFLVSLALLPLAAPSVARADFDYDRLSVLLPQSDHVVLARITKVEADHMELAVVRQFLGELGAEEFSLERLEGAAYEACAGEPRWEVGRISCYFLQRAREGQGLQLVAGGAGQRDMPLFGVFDEHAFAELLDQGTLSDERLSKLLQEHGAGKMTWVLRDVDALPGYAVDWTGPLAQGELMSVLSELRARGGTPQQRVHDVVAALGQLAPATRQQIPQPAFAEMVGLSRQLPANQGAKAVELLELPCRAGFAPAVDALDGLLRQGSMPLPAKARAYAALLIAGRSELQDQAWAAYEGAPNDHQRTLVLRWLLEGDREQAEERLLEFARDEGFPHMKLELLGRAQGEDALQRLGEILSGPNFSLNRMQAGKALRGVVATRAGEAARKTVLEAARARFKRPFPDASELVAWIDLYSAVSDDRAPVVRPGKTWLERADVGLGDRLALVKAMEGLLGRTYLKQAQPNEGELQEAIDRLLQEWQ